MLKLRTRTVTCRVARPRITHQRPSYSQRRYCSTTKTKEYDILIVGGGMAGLSMACALGSLPICKDLSIGLVEGNEPINYGNNSEDWSDPPKLPEIPELRVSAISTAIGVWDDVLLTRAAPYYDMKVWDSNFRTGGIAFSCSDVQLPYLGAIVENKVLQWALYKKARHIPNLELLTSTSIESIELPKNTFDEKEVPPVSQPAASSVTLTTKDGRKLSTRLLIGADGYSSVVRQQAGISTFGYSYQQKGVVTVVEHEETNTTAWQRFLPDGPIALLPLPGNYSSIVWSVPSSDADTLLRLSDEEFTNAIRKAFTSHNIVPSINERASVLGGLGSDVWLGYRHFLEKAFGFVESLSYNNFSEQVPNIVRVVGPRGAFPLRLSHAQDYIRDRVALIGDACHVVHPLAGQGINLGIQDCISLANVIAEGVETGQDIGSVMVLQRYQSNRKFANLTMQFGIDAIHKLFGAKFTPAILARAAGVALTNNISPLKNLFASMACGVDVDLSKFQRIATTKL